VYALAADMGGMGFISANHATIQHNNTLIDINTRQAAAEAGVQRLLYTSSACVYPEHMQLRTDIAGLREEDAYPAAPQDAYGWEKVLGEQLCKYYPTEFGMETRVVRFHNIYGPYGTYDGGREKSPAAMCRKVALADDGGSIEIWGDGEQTRSFTYIDDCVYGTERLMWSDVNEPLNVGSSELVSINQMVDIVECIAWVKLERN
jgi:GDP-D-mannose 3',5'-epimerase